MLFLSLAVGDGRDCWRPPNVDPFGPCSDLGHGLLSPRCCSPCGSLLTPAQTGRSLPSPHLCSRPAQFCKPEAARVRGPGPCCWPSKSRAAHVSGGAGQAGGRPLRARKLREGSTGAASHLTRQRVLTPGWPPRTSHCPVPGPAAGHVVTRASETALGTQNLLVGPAEPLVALQSLGVAE